MCLPQESEKGNGNLTCQPSQNKVYYIPLYTIRDLVCLWVRGIGDKFWMKMYSCVQKCKRSNLFAIIKIKNTIIPNR